MCPYFVVLQRIISQYHSLIQLNKANTSDKETSVLDFNLKVIGSNIHTSVNDERDDFWFPIVNFPWLGDDVPRLPSYGIYILQFDLLYAVLAGFFFVLKSSNHFKAIDTGLQISQASENVWEVL